MLLKPVSSRRLKHLSVSDRAFTATQGFATIYIIGLMTGLPNGGTHTRPDGSGTLLAQAEWCTVLKYCNTGNGASRGRFDIGVADPEELDSPVPRPLMTFECGRNKSASVLLGDIDAAADHEGPSPADITKLAREIKHATLPLGYALEFYDDDHRESERLTERVREWISTSKCDGLRVVVLSCSGGERPSVIFCRNHGPGGSGWSSQPN